MEWLALIAPILAVIVTPISLAVQGKRNLKDREKDRKHTEDMAKMRAQTEREQHELSVLSRRTDERIAALQSLYIKALHELDSAFLTVKDFGTTARTDEEQEDFIERTTSMLFLQWEMTFLNQEEVSKIFDAAGDELANALLAIDSREKTQHTNALDRYENKLFEFISAAKESLVKLSGV